MPAGAVVAEGFIPFRGYKTWYRIVGDREESGKLPLLILHGGPGAGHDYLEPLGALTENGRRVIFYDQLGSGRSDHPHNPSMWTPGLFVEEIGAVRDALGLTRVHILGQSWGGMLGMEYALTHPSGLVSLIVSNSPASMSQFLAGVNSLRDALPPGVQATLLKHEQAGTTDDPEYEEAVMVFYRRHLCRLDPFPECLARTFENIVRYPEVYHTMNGPSEFHVIGTIKDWDIRERLREIRTPTLVIGAEYDEVTVETVETVHRGICHSELVVFDGCSHCCHLEEPDRYNSVVEEFLSRVEAQT